MFGIQLTTSVDRDCVKLQIVCLLPDWEVETWHAGMAASAGPGATKSGSGCGVKERFKTQRARKERGKVGRRHGDNMGQNERKQ